MPTKIGITEVFAHHSTAIGGILFISGFALIATLGGYLGLVAGIVVALQGGLFLHLGGRSHDRKLCTRCAAAMPLNPSAEAESRRWALGMTHYIIDQPRSHKIIIFVVLVVAPGFLPGWVLPVFAAAVAALYLAADMHGRYSPWCPFCDPR